MSNTSADNKTVLLAYSGGLDTSCILVWLKQQGYKVVTFMADVGQDEDFKAAEAKAIRLGAEKFILVNLKEEFVENYIMKSVQANGIYEERYLLGTALARPCISKAMVEAAIANNAAYISHGATGKGNDQIRFELSCYALYPQVKIIAPWRIPEFYQRFPGRPDLLKFASENNIPVAATTKDPWSMDANIMHISYESGILEDPATEAPTENFFQMTTDPELAPDQPSYLQIHFEKGIPNKIVDLTAKVEKMNRLDIFTYLNTVGGKHGVGRIDIVENRFTGMKSRGIYESPGAEILYNSHVDLELCTLDREMRKIKQELSIKFSEQVYNGLWFSPECEFTRTCIELSQANVNGWVKVKLFKGHVYIMARYATNSLYNQDLVSMDIQGNFEPKDTEGFIRINAVRLKEYKRISHNIKCENGTNGNIHKPNGNKC